jgi:hypothetical protein
MESIVLDVDDELAKAWKNGSPYLRATYEDKINAVLREFQKIEEAGLTKEQREFLKAEAANHKEIFEWWKDEEFVAELEQRSADLDSGKDKGISWEDAKAEILNRGKKNAI